MEERQAEGAGVHGGPIDRFHAASQCSLVNISTLSGNWTHGDYVSAVEALGDAAVIPVAAHSGCGKPMVSVGHRHGPPDFVLNRVKERVKSGKETGSKPGGARVG
jgi:hypothetical protein